jgi:predicted phage terminase large subunit-like protein
MSTSEPIRQQLQMEELLRRWERVKVWRNRARRSLDFLCREILGYRDVNWAVHEEIIQNLQKFKGGTDVVDARGMVTYTPEVPLWEMQGPRNSLTLFPRGHLKTSIVTIAHTIQWILNYPNVRILISTATGDQCKKMLNEIKSHFQFNKQFRYYFSDFCPMAKKAADFGSQEEFTVPNRTVHRKEPTVSTCSVGKVIAGAHYEVIKNSDLVDKENVKTPGQIADVIGHFGYLNPLLERSEIAPFHGWTDVEGTRYDFGDLYGRLLAGGTYRTVVRPRTDEDTVWPARFPVSELKRIEKEVGPYIYSCQYRNRPIPPEGGLCDPRDIVFVPRQVISSLLPTLRLHCTIDLHGLEPSKNDNDFTALTVHGFDRDGRMYIVDVRHGRFTPTDVIWHIFNIHGRYPHLVDFKIEKEAHARVLLPFLQREASKRQRFPCMVPIKRDTHVSKQQRIRGLQPWFKAGIIRFADDLACKTELILEIMQFPSQSAGVHDDILDTLADAMQNQEGGVTDDVVASPYLDPQEMFGMEKPKDRFLGFGQDGQEQWLYGNMQKEVLAPLGVL